MWSFISCRTSFQSLAHVRRDVKFAPTLSWVLSNLVTFFLQYNDTRRHILSYSNNFEEMASYFVIFRTKLRWNLGGASFSFYVALWTLELHCDCFLRIIMILYTYSAPRIAFWVAWSILSWEVTLNLSIATMFIVYLVVIQPIMHCTSSKWWYMMLMCYRCLIYRKVSTDIQISSNQGLHKHSKKRPEFAKIFCNFKLPQ